MNAPMRFLDSILEAVSRLRNDEEMLELRSIDEGSADMAELKRIDLALWELVDREAE